MLARASSAGCGCDNRNTPRSETRTVRPPNLEVQDLLVRYSSGFGAVTALEIDHLSVPPGALLAVTGPSGSGKSTLLYAIAGLLRPERGDILWDARNILAETESARDRWRRHSIGIVFQDFHLLPELTPLQNVLLPASFERLTTDRANSGTGRFAARTLRVAAGAAHHRNPVTRRTATDRACPRPVLRPAGPARRRADRKPRCRCRSHGDPDSGGVVDGRGAFGDRGHP